VGREDQEKRYYGAVAVFRRRMSKIQGQEL
jgi:hypothetical protein